MIKVKKKKIRDINKYFYILVKYRKKMLLKYFFFFNFFL